MTTANFGKIAGTKLTPQVVSIPIDILPALGTPQLGTRLDFGTLEGADKVSGTAVLPVTGPGCVWRGDQGLDVQTGPENVGTVGVSSANSGPGNCIQVADGQRAELTLRLDVEHAGNGTLAGTVPITVTPLDHPEKASTVQVPFTANLLRPLNVLRTGLAFVAALILGPGIPLLLLALVKRFTARIPGRPLLARDIPVTVDGNEVLRDGAPLALRDTDFRELVPLKDNGSRTAEIPGGTLRTRTGWSPFGAGFVEAELPGRVGLSSTFPRPWGRRQSPRLPLAVHNTWLVSRDPAAPPNTATVLLLAGVDAQGDRRQALVDDVRARLPGLMSLLGASASPSAPADPFGGPPSGGASADPFGFAPSTAPTAAAGPAYPAAPAAQPGETSGWSGWPSGSPAQPSPTSGWPPAGTDRPAPGQFPDPAAAPPENWSFDSGFENDDPGKRRR